MKDAQILLDEMAVELGKVKRGEITVDQVKPLTSEEAEVLNNYLSTETLMKELGEQQS